MLGLFSITNLRKRIDISKYINDKFEKKKINMNTLLSYDEYINEGIFKEFGAAVKKNLKDEWKEAVTDKIKGKKYEPDKEDKKDSPKEEPKKEEPKKEEPKQNSSDVPPLTSNGKLGIAVFKEKWESFFDMDKLHHNNVRQIEDFIKMTNSDKIDKEDYEELRLDVIHVIKTGSKFPRLSHKLSVPNFEYNDKKQTVDIPLLDFIENVRTEDSL